MSVSSASTIKSQCELLEKSDCHCAYKEAANIGLEEDKLRTALSIKRNSNATYLKIQEQAMMNKLRKNFSEKMKRDKKNTMVALSITGRISHETLVLNWFKSHKFENIDTKVYLIENLLPCLVLGLEQLLSNVYKRKEADIVTLSESFNPINFLGRYLMRNNPRYCNFSEASPYVRGLRIVLDELKHDVAQSGQPNSLKELKAEAKRRRHDREKVQRRIVQEKRRRLIAVVKQYEDWTERLVDSNGNPMEKVDVALVQNSLRSFLEIVIGHQDRMEQVKDESIKSVAQTLLTEFEPTDESGRMMTVREYAEYMKKFAAELNDESFNDLLLHLTRCAKDFRTRMLFEARRFVLSDIFSTCDNSCVGKLDRHRIINLFEEFYDKNLNLRQREMVRNPRKWPVIEVTEEEWMSDDFIESEDEQDPKFYDNNMDVTIETKKIYEVLNEIKNAYQKEQTHEQLIDDVTELLSKVDKSIMRRIESKHEDESNYPKVDEIFENYILEGNKIFSKNEKIESKHEGDIPNIDENNEKFEENKTLSNNENYSLGFKKSLSRSDEDVDNINSLPMRSNEDVDNIDSLLMRSNEDVDNIDSLLMRSNEDVDNIDSLLMRSNEDVDNINSLPMRSNEDVDNINSLSMRSNEDGISLSKWRKGDESKNSCNREMIIQFLNNYGYCIDPYDDPDDGAVSSRSNESLFSNDFPEGDKAEVNSKLLLRKHRTKVDNQILECRARLNQRHSSLLSDDSPIVKVAKTSEDETMEEVDSDNVKNEEKSENIENTNDSDIKDETANKDIKIDDNTEEDNEDQIKDKDNENDISDEKDQDNENDISDKKDQDNENDISDKKDQDNENDISDEKDQDNENDMSDEKDKENDISDENIKDKENDISDKKDKDVDKDISVEEDKNKDNKKEDKKENNYIVKEGSQVSIQLEKAKDYQEPISIDVPIQNTAKTSLSTNKDISLENTSPGTLSERPPLTQQSRVSFAEGTSFQQRYDVLTSHGSRSHSQASAFDADCLNVSQFVQLIETFLGDSVHQISCKNTNSNSAISIFDKLSDFILTGYVETETERLTRIAKARNDLRSAKQKTLLNSLFEMWDNEGCGQLAFDEVTSVMIKYKDTMESEAIQNDNLVKNNPSKFIVKYIVTKKGIVNIKKKNALSAENRINKQDFRKFIFDVVSNMNGMDEFDYFIDYLLSNVERSYAERVRGEARKQWLQNIINAASTSGAAMQPIYTALFQALYKDAESHGGNKEVSAYISLLEKNALDNNDQGMLMLRYVACTPFDAPYVLGKAMFNDSKGLSFQCLESGKPMHVAKLSPHNNIRYWNTDRAPEDICGSLILLPIKDRSRKVFGILGVDTMNDSHSRGLFITHEIQFYQGICQAFSIAYHQNLTKQKAMRISESAIAWIRRRSTHISKITVYIVEPDGKLSSKSSSNNNLVLRRMLETTEKGSVTVIKAPPRLDRKDNLFRDYLFKCVDNSETISADAYGERHIAVPMRDHEGWATIVIDISLKGTKELPKLESYETSKMLRLLQVAYKEIYREANEGPPNEFKLEGEKNDDDTGTGIMFDRLMLIELRENVKRLNATAYAEMRSYQVPPPVIHLILKAVLSIFYHKEAKDGEFENWSTCKQYVKSNLSQLIVNLDPTMKEEVSNEVPLALINSYLDEVPHGSVNKHGSKPAEMLYNWAFVCVSLIEHTRKMAAGRPHDIADQIAAIKRPGAEKTILQEDPDSKDDIEEDNKDEVDEDKVENDVTKEPEIVETEAQEIKPEDENEDEVKDNVEETDTKIEPEVQNDEIDISDK